jgi:AraC family transcriptional regulator of adaptative response / DNA-3-methyladenine glycosylase II
MPIANENGFTHLFPSAEKLGDVDLGQIGLPRARAHCIRSLARAVCNGKITFSGVANLPDFVAQFCELPGIGDWTAQYVAMRALGEPDAFPASDLGLLRATGLRDPGELQARADAWRPWRAYAALYLWQPPLAADPRRAPFSPSLLAKEYRPRMAAGSSAVS